MFLSSLFLDSNIESRKETTAYTGVEGLFSIWSELMTMYKTAVIEHHVQYQRFAEDFINSRKFHDSYEAWEKNQHQVILGRITTLLKYESMVRQFAVKTLDRDNFEACMNNLMLKAQISSSGKLNYQCHFSPSVISVITREVNAIPLFKHEVSETDMELLFNECSPVSTPKFIAHNNQVLAYFFYQMDMNGLIGRNYQMVTGATRLIGSSRHGSPLSAHHIARALEDINDKVHPIKNKIIEAVKRIRLESLKADNDQASSK